MSVVETLMYKDIIQHVSWGFGVSDFKLFVMPTA